MGNANGSCSRERQVPRKLPWTQNQGHCWSQQELVGRERPISCTLWIWDNCDDHPKDGKEQEESPRWHSKSAGVEQILRNFMEKPWYRKLEMETPAKNKGCQDFLISLAQPCQFQGSLKVTFPIITNNNTQLLNFPIPSVSTALPTKTGAYPHKGRPSFVFESKCSNCWKISQSLLLKERTTPTKQ